MVGFDMDYTLANYQLLHLEDLSFDLTVERMIERRGWPDRLRQLRSDEAKRKQMYADMQTMIHNEAGIGIPLFLASIDGHSTKLKGLSPIPLGGLMGYMFAEHAWLDAWDALLWLAAFVVIELNVFGYGHHRRGSPEVAALDRQRSR